MHHSCRTPCFVFSTFYWVIDSPLLLSSTLWCLLTPWSVSHWNGKMLDSSKSFTSLLLNVAEEQRNGKKMEGKDEMQTEALKHTSCLKIWCRWKMSNYPSAWHTKMKYLVKLLMSDKLSTVKVSVQQAPSICNVGRIIKWGNIKFCFPDKSLTPKEPENYLLRHGLNLMPIQAARVFFTVTTKAKNECNEGTVRRFG